LAWNNWSKRGKRIFSNYNLYGFPFTKINSIPDLDLMKEGFFAGDELWLYVDCIDINTYVFTHDNILRSDKAFFNNPLLSIDFENNTLSYSVPIAQFKRSPNIGEKLIKISTRTREIIVSKNHRFFTINRDTNFWNRHKNENPLKFIKEKKAEELRVGDRVIMVHKIPEPQKELIDPRLSQLIGYITADGNIEYPQGHAIHIDDRSKECLKEYKKLAEELGFSTSLHKHTNVNCYRLRLFGKEKILNLIKEIKDSIEINKELKCPTSRIVRIPEKIIKSNNKVLSAFLRGFFDGDAYIKIEKSLDTPYGSIKVINSKKHMLEMIKYLLLRFGIECSKVFERIDKKRNCKFYEICIKDSLSLDLFKKIGFTHPEKLKLLNKLPLHKTKRKIIGEIEIGYITNIEEVKPQTEYLVDFTIPIFQNYIANGFVVHNSWASKSEKTKIISSILLKSRKRDITIAFTSQTIGQITTRIRQVVDFISYPILSLDNSYCRLEIFRAPNPTPASRIKPPIYFHTEPVFAMFSTREEVKPIDVEEKDKFKEIYLPITENPDWIRYLREQKGFDDLRIKKYSEMIEKVINPKGITSTKEMEETI
jgi:intein/homing endonuclease